ncbi:MAG: hypothetical protein R2755_24695 [Acidimicrobiales bacterium]
MARSVVEIDTAAIAHNMGVWAAPYRLVRSCARWSRPTGTATVR